ncbi:TPR-like protein [Daldinia eschscholtzii]|nr:TPR-like protein [Daldinia eschscholtzii]
MLEEGLHVLFDSSRDSPDHDIPEIDIVAAHGLNFMNKPDHAQDTWKAGNSLWLTDFLPGKLEKPARIMLFSYNSSPAISASALKLDDHAKNLLQCLEVERQEAPERPLIFICHSLGGLVVKEALIEANQDIIYRPILEATRLLVFFATPHRGGNYANIGDVVAKIVKFGSGNRRNNKLLDELKRNSDSATKRFAQSRHIYERCLIVNFFEGASYGKLGIIVNQNSATLGLPGSREKQVPVAANHSSICKFDSIDNANCKLVLGTIVRQIGLALDIEPRNKHWTVPRSASPIFTGRRDIIQKIKSALTSSRPNTQKRFVITGIGGMGKSEVCLRVADELRERFWGVFWVDVSSDSTTKAGFSAIATTLGSKGTGVDDTRLALSNIDPKHPWLLILDNADDLNIDYQQYFPSGIRGAVIITSRNPGCRTYATVGSEDLTGLNKEHCISLLQQRIKSASDLSEVDSDDAARVVDILGSHTLAILQAGAYIAHNYCSLKEYPDIFKEKRERLLKFNLTQDQSRYRNVYATLEASAEVLRSMQSKQAQDSLCLLQVLSALHYENMPLDVFQDAWNGAQEVRDEAEGEVEDDRVDYLNYLTDKHVSQLPDFLESHRDTWDAYRMSQAVDLLESLALIRKSSIYKCDTVSMHPLVHSWINLRQTQTEREEYLDRGLCIFALSRYYQADWRPYRSCIGPHVLSLLEPGSFTQKALRDYLLAIYVQIGWLLDELRYDRELEELLEYIFSDLDISRNTPTERFLTLYELSSQNANQRGDTGDTESSVQLLEQIVQIKRSTLDETHPDRLNLEHNLARAYLKNGQLQEAINRFEYIIQIERSTLDETDPSRLTSQHNLARAYLENGQLQEAINLFEYIIQIERSTLDETDPNRLTSQHELARAYLENGQLQEAINLFEYVVQISKATLKETHPDRLASEGGLARAYLENGQIQEAINLFEYVVQIRKVILQETHPDQLASQHNLAGAYLKNGQLQEAINLFEYIIQIERSTLDETDPSRLTSQHNLARAYLENGQLQEAINLFEYVVQIRKVILQETHPDQLASQHNLACGYLANGQIQEAIGLLEQVVEIKRTTLDETNRSRILSQELLAAARQAYAEMTDPQSTSTSSTIGEQFEPEEKRKKWYKLSSAKRLFTGKQPSTSSMSLIRWGKRVAIGSHEEEPETVNEGAED